MDYGKINIKTDIGKANLLMHISNFNNLPSEDFSGAFISAETVDYALGDESVGAWGIVGFEDTARAKKLLLGLREDLNNGVTVTPHKSSPPHIEGETRVLRTFQQEITKPLILKTNNGTFKSIETIRSNMGKVYPLITQEKIDIIFASSRVDLGLDSDVEYLDDTMFIGMVSIVKIKCDEDVISLLSGEVADPPEKCEIINPPEKSKVVEVHDELIITVDEGEVEERTEEILESEELGPPLDTHPYMIYTPAGVTFFKKWDEALRFQKEFNKSNKTRLRAIKRK